MGVICDEFFTWFNRERLFVIPVQIVVIESWHTEKNMWVRIRNSVEKKTQVNFTFGVHECDWIDLDGTDYFWISSACCDPFRFLERNSGFYPEQQRRSVILRFVLGRCCARAGFMFLRFRYALFGIGGEGKGKGREEMKCDFPTDVVFETSRFRNGRSIDWCPFDPPWPR